MANPNRCCARTSAAFSGIRTASNRRSRASRAVTAHSTRSLTFVATRIPWLTAFTECPDRPIRCKVREIPFGAEIITTRSIAPISTPISSEVEQTTARNSPFFNRSSTSSRTFLSNDEW